MFLGYWRIDAYRRFVEEASPPAQLCPVVWQAPSMGALGLLKHLTGRWPASASPRHGGIARNRIRRQRINGCSLQTLLAGQRQVLWRAVQTRWGPVVKALQGSRWRWTWREMPSGKDPRAAGGPGGRVWGPLRRALFVYAFCMQKWFNLTPFDEVIKKGASA